MNEPRFVEARHLTCAQVDELAGLFVIDALEPAEAAAVSAHLATCPLPHETFAALAQGAAALAIEVEPVDAPAELRGRVLAAIEATPQVPDALPSGARAVVDRAPGRGQDRVTPFPKRRWSMAGLAAAAVLVVAVVGGLGMVAWQRAGDAESRLALLRRAVAAVSDPSANVASLAGSDSAAGASGFAVFPAGEQGFIVIEGLPGTSAGDVYQAWYLAGGVPTSAGIVSLGGDGLATLTGLEPVPGTDTIALTIEPSPGSEGPTSTPIVVGELRAATAEAPWWLNIG